jgi:hypothetical protein
LIKKFDDGENTIDELDAAQASVPERKRSASVWIFLPGW